MATPRLGRCECWAGRGLGLICQGWIGKDMNIKFHVPGGVDLLYLGIEAVLCILRVGIPYEDARVRSSLKFVGGVRSQPGKT